MKNWIVIAIVLGLVAGRPRSAAAQEIDFDRDIRPILATNCYACHGPDGEARQADLRLDTFDGATADLGGYTALKPGQADASVLVERVESDDENEVMPPADSGHRLTKHQKDLLRRWVDAGGHYTEHWAFVPPSRDHQTIDPQTHPIDHLVRAKLEEAGLQANPEADRYQLLRRVTLDLTGLPPTIQAADAFLADTSPQAYEKVVDRLLASDAFGEHWARMWLDIARYADTKGYEKDKPREIWRYRDWVIDAFNSDLPFDQFTIEQLAGDLLPDATVQQRLATAFHRNTLTNEEGGTDDEEFRVAAVKDRVDTTVQAWMGLTMGCAKCHSHKYDPISQTEYYRFYAFFNQTADADREAPLMPAPTRQQQQRADELQAQLATLREQLDAGASTLSGQIESAEKSLAAIRAQFPKIPVMQELAENKRRQTRIHNRGNFLDPADVVEPAVPAFFGTLPPHAPANRLGVARWLMDANNPLTARVMANRLWARLFGIGLVETEEDFGTQGLRPSHPQLLDWLAVELRENGWSIKQLIRTIVTSDTYLQSSSLSKEKLAKDPRNRLLSRGPRFRMTAEMLRDQALAASGLLTRKIGGPSVMPPQPDGIWKSTYSAQTWVNAKGENRYRRGLYTYWKRTSPYPAMTTFDAGSGEVCLIRRVRTNTPLQALITLNDPAFIEAAGALALRLRDGGIQHGFRRVLTRPATPEEVSRLEVLFESTRNEYARDLAAAANLAQSAGLPRISSNADLAAWITVANVLLNLDETLTKP
ncbi:MAG: PSD1 and planctomycete cytochrome C domain-containing protein [Pirellulales bacterium]|nr:PSD1 and planctomycete cytochrome C domain-containing protein [Pirellulales bacterium]